MVEIGLEGMGWERKANGARILLLPSRFLGRAFRDALDGFVVLV